MTFEDGQILMYAEFLEKGDEAVRFVVVEDRDTRVLVEEICDLPWPPQRSLPKSSLVLAPDQELKQTRKAPTLR